ncbi:30S ribosomal protein S20 [bacterium]|nr:30S ribosomal protein S20 [bacterium]
MANTRKATKRAKVALVNQSRNSVHRSAAKTALRNAIAAVKAKDAAKAKDAFAAAIKTLSKAASKGAVPKRRAARKISRLTHLAKKTLPTLLSASK